jgi:hypothetical protein
MIRWSNRRESGRWVAMARPPKARLEFEALRNATGAELKKRFSNVLSEPIPEAMAELVARLDQPQETVETPMTHNTSGNRNIAS